MSPARLDGRSRRAAASTRSSAMTSDGMSLTASMMPKGTMRRSSR